MATQKLLVVGGNGFVGECQTLLSCQNAQTLLIGSAVCRVAVGRGWDVTSISRSGKPYASAKDHIPAWSHEVCYILAAKPFDLLSIDIGRLACWVRF